MARWVSRLSLSSSRRTWSWRRASSSWRSSITLRIMRLSSWPWRRGSTMSSTRPASTASSSPGAARLSLTTRVGSRSQSAAHCSAGTARAWATTSDTSAGSASRLSAAITARPSRAMVSARASRPGPGSSITPISCLGRSMAMASLGEGVVEVGVVEVEIVHGEGVVAHLAVADLEAATLQPGVADEAVAVPADQLLLVEQPGTHIHDTQGGKAVAHPVLVHVVGGIGDHIRRHAAGVTQGARPQEGEHQVAGLLPPPYRQSLAEVLVASGDLHVGGEVPEAADAHRGVDHEAREGDAGVAGLALQQAVERRARLAQIGEDVADPGLHRLGRHRPIAPGHRLEYRPVHDVVEGEDPAIEALPGIIRVALLDGRRAGTAGQQCHREQPRYRPALPSSGAGVPE